MFSDLSPNFTRLNILQVIAEYITTELYLILFFSYEVRTVSIVMYCNLVSAGLERGLYIVLVSFPQAIASLFILASPTPSHIQHTLVSLLREHKASRVAYGHVLL